MSLPLETRRRIAADTLRVDVTAAEVIASLRGAGVAPILLKGASLRGLLYEHRHERPYTDIDLLVQVSDLDRSHEVLTAMGYSASRWRTRWEDTHACEYIDSDRPVVDLHRTLPGSSAPPDRVWAALGEHCGMQEIGGAGVEILDTIGLLLTVALKVAQDGGASPAAAELDRAVMRCDLHDWRKAAALAGEIDALDAFAGGLRATAAGQVVAASLSLGPVAGDELRLRLAGASTAAQSLARLVRLSGWQPRLRLVWHRLLPEPAVIRGRCGFARRSRAHLVVAYVWGPFDLLGRLPAAAIAWRRRSTL